MRAFASVLFAFCSLGIALPANEFVERARQLEKNGDSAGARAVLEERVRAAPNDVETLTAYAEFLDSHNDVATFDNYEKLLGLLRRSGETEKSRAVARRLAVLALIADEREAARRYLEEYRVAGGTGLELPQSAAPPVQMSIIEIPGPLASFARMTALSPDLLPEQLLPALARNVVTNGYHATSSSDSLDQTEYMKLIIRYLSQARELEKLATDGKAIRIETCESSQTADLLRVLGFRMRGGCGSEVVLETVNATRAFLSMDSGFPIAELEQALRTNRLFTHDFERTKIPVLYTPDYWIPAKDKQDGEFIDAFLNDPALCRLYLGLAKLDRETAEVLREAVPMQRLKAFAHVLDFFGGEFKIRGGKAAVPGGSRAAAAWNDLVGAPPDNGAAFYERLVAKDDGWLAGYYDALARIDGPTLDYLTEPSRLKRFYAALRGRVTSPGPARPVFRSNTDLMLLTARLRVDAGGRVHIPGGVEVWKNLFVNHPHGKYDGKLTRLANSWKDPDDVLEALFALCRKAVENEPLKIFMAISDLNRRRERPLEPSTVDRLAREYRALGAQYVIFNETPALADSTIISYLDTAAAISKMRDNTLKADIAGTMQSLVGLWQILTRHSVIPAASADATLARILGPFGGIRNSRDLFDHGRSSVKLLLQTAGVGDDASPQDRMIDLLAGTASPKDVDAHHELVSEMIRIFEAQRLVSLTTIFELADHLDSLATGEKLDTTLVNRLASRISEIQLPRSPLTAVEKNAFAFGYWTERHVEAQRKVNFRALIDRNSSDPERLREARGLLAPFLRDTLVGFNYIHYAPPGAQVLYTNPLFVRTHDFIGMQGSSQTWKSTEVLGTGWPSSGGGRLVGSLATLPHALADAEQNFMIPTREQALIWGDLVPQLVATAKVPRWWNVTPEQTQWVALHMHHAETLVAEAALQPALRQPLLDSLEKYAAPARVRQVSDSISAGEVKRAIELITPAELFFVGADMIKAQPDRPSIYAGRIRQLQAEHPDRLTFEAISEAFGTPKPTLANSYHPQLLNLRTFPTLMGYSSRIMAEGWESNLLYYAALASDLHMPPSQLNFLVPQWTQKTVEQIFATHLEDWPALLRSLRVVGEEIRLQTRMMMGAEQKASLQ
ncbi:MAG: tetratricopeptide repeat protein [Bryobacteraceae bacterium]